MAFGDRLSRALGTLSEGLLSLGEFRKQQREAVARTKQQEFENENALTRIGIGQQNVDRANKQFKSNEAQRFLDNLFRTSQSDERIRQFKERQLQQGGQFDQTFGLSERRVSLAESRPLQGSTTKTRTLPVGLQTQAFTGAQDRFFETRLEQPGPDAPITAIPIQPPITQATQDSSVVAGANAVRLLSQQLGFGGGDTDQAILDKVETSGLQSLSNSEYARYKELRGVR